MVMARIGLLALQGDFEAHAAALTEVGADVSEVRHTTQLDGLDGLVIPGGESTALLNLMGDEPWFDALVEFHHSGGALMGTCAGAILLAKEVTGPAQPSLGLLDVTVQRNAYGRQLDSFETEIDLEGSASGMQAVFIRAPRFIRIGPGVEVLASRMDGSSSEAVLVRQDRILAAAFHPELTADRRLQHLFLDLVNTESITTRERTSGEASNLAIEPRSATC
jgi:5'-phosphate synthase pdxT subunit